MNYNGIKWERYLNWLEEVGYDHLQHSITYKYLRRSDEGMVEDNAQNTGAVVFNDIVNGVKVVQVSVWHYDNRAEPIDTLLPLGPVTAYSWDNVFPDRMVG